ncbi:MAG TPA: hypothetical protein VJT50_16985 [Pyrinomonadaceae bacterium]|nr:hypothetical protein [Pyrinomonadaceae bacterium]
MATVLSLAILASDTQNSRFQQQQKDIDTSQFPTAEYGVTPGDAKERARWQAKSKKYSKKHTGRISEANDGIYIIEDWDVGLPAFPVARSAAVIIGEITSAKAYLSEDGTGIYSEFSIQVDEILKNDLLNPVTSAVPLIAEREGGRVRFTSGKIVTSRVNHQDMPRPGRRYVFFLTRTLLNGSALDGMHLLTAYELREGHVVPLDMVSEKHPINQYRGKAEEEFLTELRAVIARGDQAY